MLRNLPQQKRISVITKGRGSEKLNKDNDIKTMQNSNLPLTHYLSVLSQVTDVQSENLMQITELLGSFPFCHCWMIFMAEASYPTTKL